MRARKLAASVALVLLVTLTIGSAQAAPPTAGPKGQVTGVLTGLFGMLQPDMTTVMGEFQAHLNIQQLPGGGAKGWAWWKSREGPGAPWRVLKFTIDCVEFLTYEGKPAAIYSGTIIKSEWPDWCVALFGDYTGQLKICMVVDGGTGAEGDELHYWVPPPYSGFFPNEGTPLNCVVPDGALEVQFELTGGDVVIKPN